MQCTSILLTGKTDDILYIYSIPIGLLTEGILHANNARDIKADTKIGAYTLASLIGIEYSYIFYIFSNFLKESHQTSVDDIQEFMNIVAWFDKWLR